MPYIADQHREELERRVQHLVDRLLQLSDPASDGDLNFVISTLLAKALRLDSNPKYGKINTAVGVLECVKLELYRRLAVPYEDRKIELNGDISVFKRFVQWLLEGK